MGATKIQWADFTWNPFWGCTKISPGCQNCYAAELGNRFGVKWGKGETRRIASEKVMNDPFRWNRKAAKDGVRYRVFCGSMMDWADMEVPTHVRIEMWNVIRRCTNLDWLMLTKRTETMAECMPPDWGEGWPHVWLGCTTENQTMANKRIKELLKIPAVIHFLSMEPLIGRINLDRFVGLAHGNEWAKCLCKDVDPEDVPCMVCQCRKELGRVSGISWLILGGESGPKARPCAMEWLEDLIEQGEKAGIPVFMKQLGAFSVSEERKVSKAIAKATGAHPDGWAWRCGHGEDNPKGGLMERWPKSFRVRQLPTPQAAQEPA